MKRYFSILALALLLAFAAACAPWKVIVPASEKFSAYSTTVLGGIDHSQYLASIKSEKNASELEAAVVSGEESIRKELSAWASKRTPGQNGKTLTLNLELLEFTDATFFVKGTVRYKVTFLDGERVVSQIVPETEIGKFGRTLSFYSIATMTEAFVRKNN